MIWGYLAHLSYNMWADRDGGRWVDHIVAQPQLRFDESLWNDMLAQMADVGMNMVVIDVGDGIEYQSRPEIAVENAWSHAKLGDELAKMRGMGLEPIPKLNFSTAHDTWLGEYSRMVSTKAYYEVCADLIAEVAALFGTPRFFHLGYDEETAGHQRNYLYAVMRQHELWWHDFLFFVEQVEKAGCRPWIWSDYIWNHPDEFVAQMPKSVLQSNWYYGEWFPLAERFPSGDASDVSEDERAAEYVNAYRKLEEAGFEQVPTGSNWSNSVNFGRTVDFCREVIAPERLMGYLQTPWKPTLEVERKRHTEAIEQVGRAISGWGKAG